MAMEEEFRTASVKMIELEEEFKQLLEKMKTDSGASEKNKERIVSSKSVEPMNRMRKNVSSVKTAEDNPEVQFLMDRLGDIFQ